MSQPQGELRKARPFDGDGPDGRPRVSRPPVDVAERDRLLAYLEKAPIVLAARGFDADQLDPAGPRRVPLTFHTDGAWIWPGSVGYYLRRHDVAPEPELVDHARRRGFQLPEVDDRTRDAAVSVITGAPLPEPARAAGAAEPAAPAAHDRTGPIEPLAGEPPVSLLGDRRLVELPAGTEVDRYGDPGGNFMYAARTPYAHRSFPPEWRNRPYHLYRLQRPLRVLTGTAVPWFEQPGGGTAYVLPASVQELLGDGTLVEIPGT
jgi:nicrotizing toxin Mtb-like protein